MSNPIGSGIVAALALTSVALAGGNDDGVKNSKNEPNTPPQDGVTVTAAAGKGITFRGDNFNLNLSNRIQVNLGYTQANKGIEDTFGVRIRRARTKLQGSAYKDTVHFLLQFEWADGQTNDINDALVMWDLYKADDYEMSLRFGQGKTLYGTEATGTSGGLEFVDRALATQVFSNSRSRQAQLVGKLGGGNLRWNAGLMNGDVAAASIGSVEDANNGGTELNWILGAAYGTGQDEIYGESRKQGALKRADEPMWVTNAAISYGTNDNNDVGGREYDALSINAGGEFWTGNLHFLGEVFIRSEDAGSTTLAGESSAFGWQAAGSYTAEPGPTIQWAYGLRLSGVHITDYKATGGAAVPILVTPLAGEGNILELSLMASAYYFGHNLKTQFGYTFRSYDPDTATVADPNTHTFEVQSQIVF